jgi:7,8-dihydropterin-6-yl-methyl-4-(beta-D-ribofuranosyl)aminobenzene 5'-phosphate synthase
LATGRHDVERLGQALLSYPIDRVYTGNCTGPKAYRVLEEVMGDRLAPFPVGTVIEA